jgi:LmbE family N-acetylglucosaminyl deacetylase
MIEVLEGTSKKKILVLATHTDDGEFGCGGTIAKLLEAGAEVYYVAFSSCDESLPPDLPKDTLIKELFDATKSLGIPDSNVRVLNYPVRKFTSFRQDILEDMVQLNIEISPDVVFLPSTYDTHQDHNTISNEGFRAFKKRTMLGYELPWNNMSFNTGCFVLLNESHVNSKISAIHWYKSQEGRPYFKANTIRALAITRGTQIGAKFSEAFEVVRLVIE